MNALFGELRAMVHQERAPIAGRLHLLLERAQALDPARYAAEWRPYLAGLPLPELEAHDLDDLAALDRLLPPGAPRRVGVSLRGRDDPWPDGDALAEALATSPLMRDVHHLRIAYIAPSTRIGPRGAAALASSPHLASLHTLDLRHCRVEDEGWDALCGAPRTFPALRTLDVSRNGITDRRQRAKHTLARWPLLRQLRVLRVDGNLFGNALADCLGETLGGAAAPALRLETLDASRVGLEGLSDYLTSANAASLRSLVCAENNLTMRLRALARSAHLDALDALDLEQNQLDDEDVEDLCGGRVFPALRSLCLGYNTIGDRGALTLAQSRVFPALRALGLQQTDITRAGLAMLQRSTTLPRGLVVDACGVRVVVGE